MRAMADSIVSSGLKDAGYEFINIDDCWQVMRSPNGTINSDPERFPGGMKALADYIHSKGLKFGVYSAQHEFTCQRKIVMLSRFVALFSLANPKSITIAGRPGSWMHEAVDVESYCDWGVDCARQHPPSSRPKVLL